ncbi:hypothetical protein ALC56_14775 [Trachymyrmex septentrionalis]|uniref:Uncharacterized protein n=1 Tax=Trachymyrmex septentrionalis TaxID=34720 RepID=A0A195ERW1_9HYME|nr:hypothetical protein ALC56_14775 [Trachymyrmex septentrionalis]
MQSEFPIRGKLFATSLVKKFHATNVQAEFFIKISSRASSPPRGVSVEFIGVVGLAVGLSDWVLREPSSPAYGRNPHGSKYIPMGFLSNFIRPYPVTYLSILSDLI